VSFALRSRCKRMTELDDWDASARIHDAARLDELRDSVGVEAFLTLAQTTEGEGALRRPSVGRRGRRHRERLRRVRR
jgi:hypothetical protein